MDDSSISAGNVMTATVARQFTPSRIERQLLAQVFELVCGLQCETKEPSRAVRSASGSYGVSEGGQAFESHVAGRRAA